MTDANHAGLTQLGRHVKLRPGVAPASAALEALLPLRIETAPPGAEVSVGGNIGDDDRTMPAVGKQLAALDSIEKGKRIRPSFGPADGEALQPGPFHEPCWTDGRSVGATRARLGNERGRRQASEGQHATEIHQLVRVHGRRKATSRLRRR